jgi:protein-S-isoprenylcysteine O-methyltransferase Ste14
MKGADRMWTPWRNKTGLAKAAAILATVLSIATVSCGVNVAVVLETLSAPQAWLGGLLVITSWVEGIAIAVSILGLIVVYVAWLLSGNGTPRKDTDD